VAGAVTLWLGEFTDSAVILGVVLANAIIGFVQEQKAVAAIDALARSMRIQATVRWDGERRRINAAGLVVGDAVLLEPGDKVPADLRLVDGAVKDLRIDESTLTGESKAVAKDAAALAEATVLADRRCMAYAGSLVVRGTGEGIVVATADATEVGRISEMISSAEQIATPLTKKIAAFSHLLLWVILAVAVVTFVVGLLRGNPASEMFKAAVALAVGAIPEGLPAAVTIMLAVGVARMAEKKAIIRKLPAVEALGSTTMICSDKTGTLAQNQMTVRAAWCAGAEFEFTGGGYDPAGDVRLAGEADGVRAEDHPALLELLACGALCNDAALVARDGRWEIHGDPTEAALVVAARKLSGAGGADLSRDILAARFPRMDAIPFESDRQFMATLHAREPENSGDAGDRVVYVKGSVERVLGMCESAMGPHGENVPLDRVAAHTAAAALAGRGLRVLAFARVDAAPGQRDLTHPMVEHGLTFVGVQGMLDPPRPEAIDAVAACQHAGVRVNMITAILLGMPLIFEAKEPGVMARPPRDPNRPLLTFELFMRTGLVSLLLCTGAMSLFHWELNRGMSEATARTAAVSVIIVGEIFYLFSSRALLRPAWAVPLFSNMWLWAGIVAMLAVQFAFAHVPIINRLFHTAPLDASAWTRVLLVGAGVLVVVESEKAIRRATAKTMVADSA
jgi:Ca2+-transporting ATPase